MRFKKGDLVEDYAIVDVFEVGKNVFLVSKSSGEQFVLKFLDQGKSNEEAKIGMTLGLKCPYLVRIFETNTLEGTGSYLIMEYCEEGDLAKLMQNKIVSTDINIYRLLFEGTQAIHTLHENDFIHRDIKPSNFFLIKGGGFKLGDYGVARVLETDVLKTLTHVGSNGYISPEILEGNKSYTNKVDIYSFGVTLLQFIIGKHPFSNADGSFNLLMAARGIPITEARTCSHPCAKLALKMIALDPAVRPSTADIMATELFAVSGALLRHSLALVAQVDALCVDNERLRGQLDAARNDVEHLKAQMAREEREAAEKRKDSTQNSTTQSSTTQHYTTQNSTVAGSAPSSSEIFKELPITILPTIPPSRCLYKEGNVVKFETGIPRAVSLDFKPAIGGIYVLDLLVKGVWCAGLASTSQLPKLYSTAPYEKDGTCSLCSDGDFFISSTKFSRAVSFVGSVGGSDSSTRLVLELDASGPSGTHTLRYFCNGLRLPLTVKDIPTDVVFTAGEHYNWFSCAEVQFISLHATAHPLLADVMGRTVEWK